MANWRRYNFSLDQATVRDFKARWAFLHAPTSALIESWMKATLRMTAEEMEAFFKGYGSALRTFKTKREAISA